MRRLVLIALIFTPAAAAAQHLPPLAGHPSWHDHYALQERLDQDRLRALGEANAAAALETRLAAERRLEALRAQAAPADLPAYPYAPAAPRSAALPPEALAGIPEARLAESRARVREILQESR